VQPTSPDLVEFAENPFVHLPHLASTVFLERSDLVLAATWGVRPDSAFAERLRIDASAVDSTIAFVRS
jgi:hypothetical protein